jgi:hypothetical protein
MHYFSACTSFLTNNIHNVPVQIYISNSLVTVTMNLLLLVICQMTHLHVEKLNTVSVIKLNMPPLFLVAMT